MSYSTTVAPCLSQEKEDFLARNEPIVRYYNYFKMYSIFIMCMLAVAMYVWHIVSEWSSPAFDLWLDFWNFGWFFVILFCVAMSNLVAIIIKHKVDAYKQQKEKC